MASQGANVFLWLTVVLPSVFGVGLKVLLGENRVDPIKPYLKFMSLLTLISINYINGSKALPAVFKTPDADFICLVAVVTSFISAVSFAAGLGLSKLFKCSRGDTLALIFSLGMSNTSTGMVLASGALADHPGVLLPMIFYTLVQQALAGLIYTYLSRSSASAVAPAAAASEPASANPSV
jgi:BASS family bile acid:Na+ symporter